MSRRKKVLIVDWDADYLIPLERPSSAPLSRFLAPDAVPRPRNGFQPLEFYVAAAFGALSEGSLLHPLQSLCEVFQHLPGGCRRVDKRLPFVFARGLIRQIGMLYRTFPRLMLGDGERMVQFRNAGLENPLELFALVRWQQNAHLAGARRRMSLASHRERANRRTPPLGAGLGL